MAASKQVLGELHEMFAEYLMAMLRSAKEDEDGLPLDAATMGVISKFLKDNEITCDPADLDELQRLKEQHTNEAKKRRGDIMGKVLGDAREAHSTLQ